MQEAADLPLGEGLGGSFLEATDGQHLAVVPQDLGFLLCFKHFAFDAAHSISVLRQSRMILAPSSALPLQTWRFPGLGRLP
jgi:hypothetical protein